MSFDLRRFILSIDTFCLNPFRAGRCLSTVSRRGNVLRSLTSQSLSSRAMSFDKEDLKQELLASRVSIPFEQGDVFRPSYEIGYVRIVVSIPFEQGDVFRHYQALKSASIKLESQSLSSRAMSFD